MGGAPVRHDFQRSGRGFLSGLTNGRREDRDRLQAEIAAVREELEAMRKELRESRELLEHRDLDLARHRAEVARIQDQQGHTVAGLSPPASPEIDVADLRARVTSLADRDLADLFVLARDEYAASMRVNDADRADQWRCVVSTSLDEAAGRPAFTSANGDERGSGVRRLFSRDTAMHATRDALEQTRASG